MMGAEFPKVSVVIPTYGGSSSLGRAVDSALLQNYGHFDVIVVDDNDPQTAARRRTEAAMAPYGGDPRILYIRHPRNQNGAAARNTGIRASDAKYICFLDDDDLFLQDRILRQVEYLERTPGFHACYCWRRQRGTEICGTGTGDLSGPLLDMSFTPTTSALMIRRDCCISLGGFDETYRRHQDFEFLLRFFERYRLGVVKEILLEFVGNDVDNQLHGRDLYDLKISFFAQFGAKIDRLDRESPGFRRRAYAAHCSAACKDLVRRGHFILAAKLWLSHGRLGGMLFWKRFFQRCFAGLRRRLPGKRRNMPEPAALRRGAR